MFGKLFGRKKKQEEEAKVSETVEENTGETMESPEPASAEEDNTQERELLPAELETFKKAMGITPHNYWTWASRTNNFKLLTDGKYVWVEGYREHIGKQLPMTQQRAWSWEYIRGRLKTFGS